MESVKKTEAYEIVKKRSGRYGVVGANRKWISGDEKVKILLAEKTHQSAGAQKEGRAACRRSQRVIGFRSRCKPDTPNHIVLLVEGLVGPVDSDAAIAWMKRRITDMRVDASISNALVYHKERSSGTMAKPRFLSVFETGDPKAALALLSLPYDHESLRPAWHRKF